jgi:serine/threonine protein kinase
MSMPGTAKRIRIICPNCGKQFLAPPAHLARRGRCSGCQHVFRLSHAAEAPRRRAHGNGASPALKPGRLLAGQYEIRSLLGRGGMSMVYEARDSLTCDRVALKILRPDQFDRPDIRACLIRELRVARRLRHPNVIALYDIRDSEEGLFFTMELVEGLTLRQMMARRGPLTLLEAVTVLRPLCLALEHAHRTTVHRDVSPENVMIGVRGLRLLDFGICRARESRVPWREVLGKGHYMPPEQATAPEAVDHRADIYPLGVMLFELLTKHSILNPVVTRLDYPGLPPRVRGLIESSVVPVRRRLRSVRDFRMALEQCLEKGLPSLHDRSAEVLESVLGEPQRASA